ncbi:hypothetical protein AC579_2791 [Pseudocercospora musae]|uniref:Uncharacterized protein n=1 Tax=Pseudocercospora musae TaxID=113226 RepID=A0A139HZ81_9PEZI|nr:hypothetical protein AC579_2791 [Pseudocercospora musae]
MNASEANFTQSRVLSTMFKWLPRGDIHEPIVSFCERHIYRPIDQAVTRLTGRRRSALKKWQIQMSTFPHFDAQIGYLHAELSDHESLDSNPTYRPDSRAFPRLLERVAALKYKVQQEKATMITLLADLVTDLFAQRKPVTITLKADSRKRSRKEYEEIVRQESEHRSKRSKLSGEIAQTDSKKRPREPDSGYDTAEESERSVKRAKHHVDAEFGADLPDAGSCSSQPSQQKAATELSKQEPSTSQALAPADGTSKPRLPTEPVATELSSQESSGSQAQLPTDDISRPQQSPEPGTTDSSNEQPTEEEEDDPGADLCHFNAAMSEGLGLHWDIFDVHQFEWLVLILEMQFRQVFDPELDQQLREESQRAHQAAQEIGDESSDDNESSDDDKEDEEDLEEEQIQASRDAYAATPPLAAVHAAFQREHHYNCALSKKIAQAEEQLPRWLAQREKQTNRFLWARYNGYFYDTRQDLEDMLNSQQMWALGGGICSQICAWR